MASPVVFSPRMGLLAAIGLCGLGLVTTLLNTDTDWSAALRAIDLPGDVEKGIHLSEVFAHGLGAASILLAVFWIAVDRRNAVCGAMLLTALAGLTANAMKGTVVRIRPHSVQALQDLGAALSATGVAAASETTTPGGVDVLQSDDPYASSPLPPPAKPDFWDSRQRSFPSGHAATAWGLAIGLTYVFPRGVVIFACFAGLACLQRMFSGAHYPSDVFAGSAIAFSWALILLSFAKTRKLFEPRQHASVQQLPEFKE